MTKIQTKMLIVGSVLILAIGYLAWSGVASGWVYFVDVDKFTNDTQLHARRVRLHGNVAAEDFAVNSAGLTASFKLAGKHAKLPVVYRGNIPELFATGKDVVVEGKLDQNGTFQADILMTKCASKYEDGGSPHGEKKTAQATEARS